MNRSHTRAVGVAILLALSGCARAHSPTVAMAAMPPAPQPPASKPARPTIDVLRIKPNELGRIPVLMYHEFGGRGGYDRNGLNIAPSTFRRHLELMYAANWYPINMRDALSAHIDVPAGKIPVVLTFDDGRATQFSYRSDGSIDPDCAVGIMDEFHAQHPDWPLRGTFYLLPDSKWNPGPFYASRTETRKLRYLQQEGFELANHSTSHTRMDRMDAHRLAWEMANCVRYIKARVPNATMDTMALPMGYVPRTRALQDVLLDGQDGPTHYHNLCICRAWSNPALPPLDKRFDPRKIERMGTSPGYVEGWIKRLKPGREPAPFVSDGDPNTVSIPRSMEKWLDRSRLDGAQVVIWDDTPPKKPKAKRTNSRISTLPRDPRGQFPGTRGL